jgi:MraZ protein
MFYGEWEYTLDDKGRITLPAKFREELGETVLLGRGTSGQVNVYTRDAWTSLAESLGQADPALELVRSARRLIFAVNEHEIDKQGRIMVPPFLRRYANLGYEAVILGNKDRFEIWNRDRWQEQSARMAAQTAGRSSVSPDEPAFAWDF